jgi:hypothetical protein
MNRTYLIIGILVACIGISVATSAPFLTANAGATTPLDTVSAILQDPCNYSNGRFQINTSQNKINILTATQNMVHYSKVIVVESLSITKDAIGMAFDLAIESI